MGYEQYIIVYQSWRIEQMKDAQLESLNIPFL